MPTLFALTCNETVHFDLNTPLLVIVGLIQIYKKNIILHRTVIKAILILISVADL